ncbi:UNVERIFIED_CONTAM: hypothetical protein FKN15_018164 [Acipenser sinensis]
MNLHYMTHPAHHVRVLAVRSRRSSLGKGSVTVALALLCVRKAKPSRTVYPHRATANPTGQMSSELKNGHLQGGPLSSSAWSEVKATGLANAWKNMLSAPATANDDDDEEEDPSQGSENLLDLARLVVGNNVDVAEIDEWRRSDDNLDGTYKGL